MWQVVACGRISNISDRLCGPDYTKVGLHVKQTRLTLPVVICLSQRLNHACLSISMAKLRMGHQSSDSLLACLLACLLALPCLALLACLPACFACLLACLLACYLLQTPKDATHLIFWKWIVNVLVDSCSGTKMYLFFFSRNAGYFLFWFILQKRDENMFGFWIFSVKTYHFLKDPSWRKKNENWFL